MAQLRQMARVGLGGRDMVWESYVSRTNGMYRQPDPEPWAQPPGSLLSHVLVSQEPAAAASGGAWGLGEKRGSDQGILEILLPISCSCNNKQDLPSIHVGSKTADLSEWKMLAHQRCAVLS